MNKYIFLFLTQILFSQIEKNIGDFQELKVLDGQTNEKSNISGDGSTDYVSVKPIWHIESLIAPDDEESLASYDIPNANMEYQPYTNGEATQSVDLTSDSNRLYLLRTSNVSVNLIKD